MNLKLNAQNNLERRQKASGLDICYNFFGLNNLLSNLTSNYCEHYMATHRGIRVKVATIFMPGTDI